MVHQFIIHLKDLHVSNIGDKLMGIVKHLREQNKDALGFTV